MGKLMIFNLILVTLIAVGLCVIKKYVKRERTKNLTLGAAAILTILFHYSTFGFKLLTGGNAMEYLSDTPNLILPIYPCNVVMWSALIFALLKNKHSKLGAFFADYLFWFGIVSTLVGMFANVDFINNPTLADYENVKSIAAHATLLFTIDESILSYKPDIITVAYGTNDYSRYETAEEYAEHTGRYIRKLASLFPNTKILGILPIYRNDQNHQVRKLYRNYSLDDARAILRGHYEAFPNGYVLEETGIPHIPQAYAPDFLHPNEFGFSLMSQGVIRKLQQILK